MFVRVIVACVISLQSPTTTTTTTTATFGVNAQTHKKLRLKLLAAVADMSATPPSTRAEAPQHHLSFHICAHHKRPVAHLFWVHWRATLRCTGPDANTNTRCTRPSHVRHFFFKYGRCYAAATVSLTNRADRAHECAAGPPSTTRHRDRSQSARACEKPKPAKCWPKSKSSQTVRVGVYSTTWVYNHTQQETDDSHKYYRSTNTFITIPGAFATNRNRRCTTTTTTAATTTTTTNVCIAINNLFYCLELANSKCIPT